MRGKGVLSSKPLSCHKSVAESNSSLSDLLLDFMALLRATFHSYFLNFGQVHKIFKTRNPSRIETERLMIPRLYDAEDEVIVVDIAEKPDHLGQELESKIVQKEEPA